MGGGSVLGVSVTFEETPCAVCVQRWLGEGMPAAGDLWEAGGISSSNFSLLAALCWLSHHLTLGVRSMTVFLDVHTMCFPRRN